MSEMHELRHQFVRYIPDDLEEGMLYVSIEFATATHKCCCGCGVRVVTPITPTDWSLIFDGETVSLNPSIGNWNFPCRSHYWVWNGKIQWDYPFSRRMIEKGRKIDRLNKAEYYRASRKEANEPESGS